MTGPLIASRINWRSRVPVWDKGGVMNLEAMRVEYADRGLRRADLKDSPFEQFEIWLRQACETQMTEPNAMSLATATAAGQPSLRTVLLKYFDESGFVFFTNTESRKAREIAQNPRVALLFPWVALERQVNVLGSAEKLSAAEVLKYFLKRPLESQLGAWASPQSRVIESRRALEMKFEEVKRKFVEGRVPLPSFWGGYRVAPTEIEFWQGAKHRLHDRFHYARQPDGSWLIQRLAP